VRLDGRRIVLNQALFAGRFGRLRTVVEARDGSLFVLTNNRDGRGSARRGDDRIPAHRAARALRPSVSGHAGRAVRP